MSERKSKHVVDIHGVVRQVKEEEVLTEQEYIEREEKIKKEISKRTLDLSPEEYKEWLRTKGGGGVPKDQTQEEAIKQRRGEAVTKEKKKAKLYNSLEAKRVAEERRLKRLEEEQAELESAEEGNKDTKFNRFEEVLDEQLEKDKNKAKEFKADLRLPLIALLCVVGINVIHALVPENESEFNTLPDNSNGIQGDLTENTVSLLGGLFDIFLGVIYNIFTVIKAILNIFL